MPPRGHYVGARERRHVDSIGASVRVVTGPEATPDPTIKAGSVLLRLVAHNASAIFGGGEIGTALLLRGLQERGHSVRMLMRNAALAERVAEYGIPVGVQHVRGDLMVADAFGLAGRFRQEHPDAVILTTFKRVVLTGSAARMARVPFVVQRIVLQGDTPARGARYRFALRRFVDAIVLNADAMRPAFVAGDPRLDARVHTILDGVREPLRSAAPGSVRAELGIPARAFVIGSVARLATQKRFDRLLRAMALLPDDIHCIIAGEGEALSSIREQAAALGMADRVHLPGFRSDLGDVFAALDLFVLSSDREGLANAMLEAMMTGVPVVSTDVSGAREALDATSGEEAAGIVTGFDEAELARAVAGLYDDRRALAALGAAARSRAQRHFGAERFLDDWERLLREGVRRART